jgi:hypothetical protein
MDRDAWCDDFSDELIKPRPHVSHKLARTVALHHYGAKAHPRVAAREYDKRQRATAAAAAAPPAKKRRRRSARHVRQACGRPAAAVLVAPLVRRRDGRRHGRPLQTRELLSCEIQL